MIEAKALTSRGPGAPLLWEDVKLDEPQSTELVVAIKACGICHADLKAAAGTFAMKPPLIIGHEGVGVVEAVGEKASAHFAPGDFVILSLGFCGTCNPCRDGHPAYCVSGFQCNFKGTRTSDNSYVAHAKSDGLPLGAQFFGQSSMSTRSLVRMECAVKVDVKDITELRTFAGMGCGFQTGCGTIMNVVKPQAHDIVLIFGCGVVGLTAVMAAALTSCTIIAVDNVESKCELALSLGATHKINPTTHDVVDEVRKLTGGKMATWALDCVGNLKVLQTGHDSLAPLGTLITVGNIAEAKPPFSIVSHILKGLKYAGVHQGAANPPKFIPHLIELSAQGKLPFDRIVKQYKQDQLEEAFHDLHSGTVVKPVIVFD